jgi:hypothetical protein
MLEQELDRATGVAFEVVNATAMHLRRIVGPVSVASARVAREVADLVWEYQDLAGDLRQSDRSTNGPHDGASIDVHWPTTEYRGGANHAGLSSAASDLPHGE